MIDPESENRQRTNNKPTIVGKLLYSPLVNRVSKFPPVAWLIRTAAKNAALHTIRTVDRTHPLPIRTARADLQSSLEGIVQDIVEVIGYAGAMIATYEQGDVLPVRAFYIDSKIASMEQVKAWERAVQAVVPDHPISLTDPSVARVYINKPEYSDNLSAKAAKAKRPMVSYDLFDLFTPIAPENTREIIAGVQQALGIQQVITIPFFINANINGSVEKDYVGNLFVASRHPFSEEDVMLLSAFAHQVAASILSERRRMLADSIQRLILDMQRSLENEQKILDRIVQGIVNDFGYTGAMVATYDEQVDALPVRAVWIKPEIASMEQVHRWEMEVNRFLPPDRAISITDPDIARVYVKQSEYQDNLSVKAAEAGHPVTSGQLIDFFIPVIPDNPVNREVLKGIQQALGIQQVIAVPFFYETASGEQALAGNLFAATQSSRFSAWEVELLQAFGQQAAVGIHNARLYKQSEDLHEASLILGKMAFSASAGVHAFRNHIGVIRNNLQLLNNLDQLSADETLRREYLAKLTPPIMDRLSQVSEIINQLHQPWSLTTDKPVDVNACLSRAVGKLLPNYDSEPWIHVSLGDNLPCVWTLQEMLTEAFRVLIKNAVEALDEMEKRSLPGWERGLWIESRLQDHQQVEVTIRDSGTGIRPEHLGHMFEMRWTTKSSGLGFGLFWAKDYITGLKGHIFLTSTWCEGSTFRVVLPAEERK